MAEYIDREKTLRTLENTAKYYEMPNADKWTKGIHYGLIHGIDNIVDNVPIEDVIERSEHLEQVKHIQENLKTYIDNTRKEYFAMERSYNKLKADVDKAIDEMNSIDLGLTMECDEMRDYCVEILKRNIGE